MGTGLCSSLPELVPASVKATQAWPGDEAADISCGTLPSRARLAGGVYAVDQASPSQCTRYWSTRKPGLTTAHASEGPEVLSDHTVRAPAGAGISCHDVPSHRATTTREWPFWSRATPASHVSAAPSLAIAET